MTTAASNRSLVLTPPGSGAIGIVRVLGPDAPRILGELFRPALRTPLLARTSYAQGRNSIFQGARLRFGQLVAGNEIIDDVVASRLPTTEPPAFDIAVHGGVRVIERIVEELSRLGAPLCGGTELPDLMWPNQNRIEQEANQALLGAQTERCARFVAWQRHNLARILLSAAVPCPKDPRAREVLVGTLAGYEAARVLLEGASVAIVGPPNSGKSTLFNCLVGRSATIVSDQPGTTRDWVTALVEIDGIPLTLVDTAGQRSFAGDLENLAMKIGRKVAQRATLCLALFDGSERLSAAALDFHRMCQALPRRLTVINKTDLDAAWDPATLSTGSGAEAEEPIAISAGHQIGLDRLQEAVLRALGSDRPIDRVATVFTPRQCEITAKALSDLMKDPSLAESRIKGELIGC